MIAHSFFSWKCFFFGRLFWACLLRNALEFLLLCLQILLKYQNSYDLVLRKLRRLRFSLTEIIWINFERPNEPKWLVERNPRLCLLSLLLELMVISSYNADLTSACYLFSLHWWPLLLIMLEEEERESKREEREKETSKTMSPDEFRPKFGNKLIWSFEGREKIKE